MLRRTQIRRYLLALLWSEEVPQDADCGLGPLWVNCDDEPVEILDHSTHQIFEDAEAGYNLRQGDAAIIFGFDRVSYVLQSAAVDSGDYSLWIDIVVHEADGHKRQNILDTIEERILYRLISYSDFTDAQTGNLMRSFLRLMDGNRLQVESRDDSDSLGDYTIRRLGFNFAANECISKPPCGDMPLCFDFTNLAPLEGGC